MASGDLADPRLVLFVVYGFFTILLVLCTASRYLVCENGHCAFRIFRRQVQAAETSIPQSDGIIWELLSINRKNEIDSLRHQLFCRFMENFSLILRKEHMVQRRSSSVLQQSQSCDEIQNNMEEGIKNNACEVDGSCKHEYGDAGEGAVLGGVYTHVAIPFAGVGINGGSVDKANSASKASQEKRELPIFCAICLSEYEIDDEICWSSNSSCSHCFHKDCMLQWLVALGRRKSSMQRFPDTPCEKRLLNFELECPCCRQSFILKNRTKEKV